MRWPVIFRGPGGPWDVSVFRSAKKACAGAEAIDVINGEYGAYGWDTDGKPVLLVAKMPDPSQGFLWRLFNIQGICDGEVRVRELDVEPEPEVLREVLTEYIVELYADLGPCLERMSMDDLRALFMKVADVE